MREIEPNYNDWSNQEINKQIDAILECGYEWVEDKKGYGFRHRESKVYLNIPKLNFYSPEQITNTYERVWSKGFNAVKAKGFLSKTLKAFGVLIMTLVIGFIFLSTNQALILNGIILIYVLFNVIQFKKYSKKDRIENYDEDDDFDYSAIVWCKNCVHFKKVKNWENGLSKVESIENVDSVPCEIYEKTKLIWDEHFDKPVSQRYLYPKNCPSFQKR